MSEEGGGSTSEEGVIHVTIQRGVAGAGDVVGIRHRSLFDKPVFVFTVDREACQW